MIERPRSSRLAEIGPIPIAAYIHVPFCRQRCGYCNFSLLANRDDLFDRYVDAVCRELSELECPRPVETVFFGGGTPSILPEVAAERLFEAVRQWFPIAGRDSNGVKVATGESGEFSIEANPLDVTKERLRFWKSQGVNRISIGGQSFQAEKLKVLERDHDPLELIQAIELSQEVMDRVSLDLIFASPGESLSGWEADLRRALELGVGHLSTYGLTYEKGSMFWGRLQKEQLHRLNEELELAMYTMAMEMLVDGGLEHYEVSNFARSGQACQHNQAYWNGDRWWGVGPSAASFLGNHRSVNYRGTLAYLKHVEQGSSAIDESEELSIDQQWRERFVFGMRQLRGVPWYQWRSEVPVSTREEIETALRAHTERGWLEEHGDYVRLTRAGLVISDGLWSDYFGN